MKEKVIQCINNKMTMLEAASHLGISKSIVQRTCRKWNLSFDRVNKVSQEYLATITSEKIKDCLSRGLTISQAAKEFKVSRTAFTNRLEKLNISFRKIKFDSKKYALLKKQGFLDKEIMNSFGMSQSGMRYAKNLHGLEKQKRNFKEITKEEIENLYLIQKISIKRIEQILNKSTTSIYELLKKFNIQLRREDGINISKIDLGKYYLEEGLSFSEIANKFRTTMDGVKLALIRYNLDDEDLYSTRTDTALNRFDDLQEQMLYGSLLGDAHLDYFHSNVLFKIMHCFDQREYVYYKYCILNNFVQNRGIKEGSRFDERTKKHYYYSKFKSIQSRIFTNIYPLFYKKNKVKYVNKEVLNKLDGRGLAFWFMDDGFKIGKYSMGIATNSFSKDDMDLIINYFKKRWNISGVISKTNQFLFKRKEALLFQGLISQHVISYFSYKLIESTHLTVIKKRYMG